MIDVLISTLSELLNIQKEFITGNADQEVVQENQKRFASALNELIDYRVQILLDRRQAGRSQERLAVADSINTAMQSTASTIKSLSALQSAPPPIENPSETEMKVWIEEYNSWYDNKRKKAMCLG
jgi:hypothetical protein